jgi:peptidoglycan/LPS O-acetylase OafA/YrhL
LDRDLFTFNPIFDKFVEYLGSRSYSLYVLHFPALVIVWKVIFKFFPFINKLHPVYYGVAQLLLFILIGVPLSEFAFRYIEKPSMTIGQTLIKKYRLE